MPPDSARRREIQVQGVRVLETLFPLRRIARHPRHEGGIQGRADRPAHGQGAAGGGPGPRPACRSRAFKWLTRSAVPRHREINDHLARKICRDLGVKDPK